MRHLLLLGENGYQNSADFVPALSGTAFPVLSPEGALYGLALAMHLRGSEEYERCLT